MIKRIFTFLLLSILVIFSNAQNSKLDSVSLINNTLYQYKGGAGTTRGSVVFPPPSGASILRYDTIWGSYYTLNAGTGVAHPGQFNFAIGDGNLDSVKVQGNAKYNVCIGQRVMATKGTGNNNVGIGWEALRENGGSDNVGISEDALRDNTTGNHNVAIGRGTMISNLDGDLNMAFGYNSLQASKHGDENVSIGDYAGAWLITGSGNVFIGSYAGESNGSDNVTQNDGIAIGRYAGIGGAIGNRSICIGYNTQTTSDDALNIGRTIFGTNLGLSTATISMTADLSAKSISVSNGYKITADDTGLTIATPTAGTKRITYDALAIAAAKPTTEIPMTLPTYPKKYMAYTTTGQALYLVEIK